ncbi:MAG: hypothetical protein HZB31_14325 [Nitrospirae bacterium]|nr:hypothetical protein [Nitrospirota bacterium]
MDVLTRLRYYRFIAGILANQQRDPLCSVCKAFTNSVQQLRHDINSMPTNTAEFSALPPQVLLMLADINSTLANLHPVADAVGQKKAGNCMLPQGICFVKSSKALIDRPVS